MPAKNRPPSRAAHIFVALLLSLMAAAPPESSVVFGHQSAQAPALEAALSAGDLEKARALIPENWVAAEQLFVSYLDRAFLSPDSRLPAPESRVLASRLADVFLRMIEYDFARAAIAAMDAADVARRQALIGALRDYHAALEVRRANSVSPETAPGTSAAARQDSFDGWLLTGLQIDARLLDVASRFRDLGFARGELHALASMTNGGASHQERLNAIAESLGDDLSLVRKLPRNEASLAIAERLGFPRTLARILETLATTSRRPADAATFEKAAALLERARAIWLGIPVKETVNGWLSTYPAPQPSFTTLAEIWSLYHQLKRPAADAQRALDDALKLGRPFGERAVSFTLRSFASRSGSLGGTGADSILEASRAFGPAVELAMMRTLAVSGAARPFRPEAAERALAFAVALDDPGERAVTLEWYAANRLRGAAPACTPLPAAFDQLLQLCLKSGESVLVAEALARVADCHLADGDTARATEVFNQAIVQAERGGGPLAAAGLIVGALDELRLPPVPQRFPPPARFELATRAIEYAKSAGSPHELAQAYRVRSQAPRGATNQRFEDLKAALAASAQHAAQTGLVREELECLRLLAQEHAMRGEYQGAVDLQLRRAAAARSSSSRTWGAQITQAEEEAAKLYSTHLGEPLLALEAAERVRQQLEGSLSDPMRRVLPYEYANTYGRLGELSASVGQPIAALEYWDASLRKTDEMRPVVGVVAEPELFRRRVVLRRAALYVKLGDYEAALKDQEAIAGLIPKTVRHVDASENLQRAQVAVDMAWTHALAGNLDKARASAGDALGLYRTDPSGAWPGMPLIDRLVDVLLLTGQPQEAIDFCVSAHQGIRRESLDQPVVERAHVEHLARAHARAGRRDQARSLWLAAADIDRKEPTAAVGGLGGSLLALGLLEIDAGNLVQARQYLVGARAAVNPYDTDRIWQIERALAVVNARTGDAAAATRHYSEALTALESVRERLRPEEFRLKYGFDRLGLYEEHAAALAARAVQSGRTDDADLAFQASERKRTQLVSGLLATGWARIPREAVPEQVRRAFEMEARLGAKQALLREQFAAPADKRNATLVDTLQRELKQLQDDHARLLASVAQGQYRFAAPAALAASLAGPVRTALGPSRVLVEYLVAADRSYAFVVSGSGTKVVPLAIGRDALRQQVRKLLLPFRQLRSGELDLARLPFDTRAAHALYEAIFAPLRPSLGPVSEIVVVPDDILTFLPFDALVEQAPRGTPRGQVLHAEFAGEKYLLHRYAISYLSSSAQLPVGAADTAAPRRSPKRFFALANPAAGRTVPAPVASQDDPLKRQLRSGIYDAFLTPLPGAESEVQRIARHFPAEASSIVRGAEATEAAYEAQAGLARVVHFATHAVASDGQPFYSTMILAPDAAPGHDGFLQAFEVLRTPLQADLVVLSGCETAMGAEDLGQGLVGLVAAFQQAGARSVLSTLWSIDEATAEVMAGFYDAMAKGASTPAALRQAKLQMLKQRLRMGQTDVSLAHPFFWAPFILVGAPAAGPGAR